MYTIWFKTGTEETYEVFASDPKSAFEICFLFSKMKITHKLYSNRGHEIKGRSTVDISSEYVNPYLPN